ncbi:kinase-like domain-containing protein [Crucibulum laeve]|uniref:Kinase-like domain-containing protein n=1 Tax=Crucibulum laeve TaxID=68775 RepID=A0A5C3LX76_9AGAR|nr:kinase-like domain-containing protein [Crucibulum laeve]
MRLLGARINHYSQVFQLAQAVNHLHKHAIIHGNIYPGNILINQNDEVVLTDTSVYLATVQYIEYPSGNVRVPASARYKSPEDRQAEHQYMEESTYAMDVFAFASTAYAIINGEALNRYLMDHRTLSRPVMMRDELWLILQKCWSPDPISRPCMNQILSSII